jgi:DNA-directed RNA polymerase subunit RPC12/RpoP
MAESMVITCPECTKKFKGKSDLQGKKIKCPFCAKPFVVAAAKAPVKARPTGGFPDEDDDGPDEYKAHEVDLTPRCPFCAKELTSATDVVCLHCGYNTQTRTMGKSVRVYGHSFGEYLMHLLPGLLSAFGILFLFTLVIWYCISFPDVARGSYIEFLDHESMRLWLTIIALGISWPIGYFAFHRLVLNPNPPDKVKD